MYDEGEARILSTGPGTAAGELRAELDRLKSNSPFEVLGVPPHATGEAVRAAFLARTKRYHPNRFARETPDVIELATEIFLLDRKSVV